ncbi:MAG: serine/threonine protein kinase [Opitutales bacterium]|nr:serine/threonine protein kinase [Opitutales bacterium]
MSDEQASFQPGERIGDYEVISILGFGATGTVYLTQHNVLKKLFAVKVLSGELAFMPEFVRVFQHEAQIVAALNHENIVPVHNFGECNGFYYYVMDFVNGGTLEDVRRRNGGRLRPKAAIALISSVARGLAYAHAYGVVHRDLKPENILLTRTGTPQITDFGMAYVDRKFIAGRRRMEERRRSTTAAKFRNVVGIGGNTSAGPSQTQIAIEVNAEDNPEVEGGTEGYIAPEVSRGNAATARADVYALGALLHFLLVGETPPEPGRLSPEVFKLGSRSLVDVLERSLSLIPTRRYPTAKEFLDALDELGNASARRRRIAFSVLGFVLICAAFSVAYTFGERTQLKKTENRVAAAAQKFFEKDGGAPGENPGSGTAISEKPKTVKVSVAIPENPEKKPADPKKSEQVSYEPSSVPALPPASASVPSASSGADVSEVAEREYWERLCAERTGRRGIAVNFLTSGAPILKISPGQTLEFPHPVSSGTYNIYLRTDGDTPESSVPVRLSIGEDQITRMIKFDGTDADAGLRFFSIVDVTAEASRIRIEIPSTPTENSPAVGIMEIEIRPTFSNADFSRMFGEFLSVITEK